MRLRCRVTVRTFLRRLGRSATGARSRVGAVVVSGTGAAVGFAFPGMLPPEFGVIPPGPRPGDIEGIPPGAACPCPPMGSSKVALDSGGPIAWMESLSGNSVPPFKTILSKAIPSVDGELP